MPCAFNSLEMGAGMRGCIPGGVMSMMLSPSVLKCFAAGDRVREQGFR